jgi:hypothetical protein
MRWKVIEGTAANIYFGATGNKVDDGRQSEGDSARYPMLDRSLETGAKITS